MIGDIQSGIEDSERSKMALFRVFALASRRQKGRQEGLPMSKKLLAALLTITGLVLLAACAGVTVGATHSKDDYNASGTAVIASEKSTGAGDLDVEILLVDPPPAVMGSHEVYLMYVFNIRNTTQAPATLKSIYVATAGGDYEIETRTRKYDKVIEPGATEKVEFLAKANGIDERVGAKSPQSIRAKVQYETADGRRSATFTRNVGADVQVTGFRTN
jgi:hypothetical protein